MVEVTDSGGPKFVLRPTANLSKINEFFLFFISLAFALVSLFVAVHVILGNVKFLLLSCDR